jgi:hypothetical protein
LAIGGATDRVGPSQLTGGMTIRVRLEVADGSSDGDVSLVVAIKSKKIGAAVRLD